MLFSTHLTRLMAFVQVRQERSLTMALVWGKIMCFQLTLVLGAIDTRRLREWEVTCWSLHASARGRISLAQLKMRPEEPDHHPNRLGWPMFTGRLLSLRLLNVAFFEFTPKGGCSGTKISGDNLTLQTTGRYGPSMHPAFFTS